MICFTGYGVISEKPHVGQLGRFSVHHVRKKYANTCWRCWHVINNSVCQAHAQFIIDPVCHFSYVLTYYELIDVKQNYGTAILATGKIQFV